MSALAWVPNESQKIGAPTCCSCGTAKVAWWPIIAGYELTNNMGREGCCEVCRIEWDTIWLNGGKT